MRAVTQADREAARELRGVLADISGFWHSFDDEGALCQALARHRAEAEQRAATKLRRETIAVMPAPQLRPLRADPAPVPVAAKARKAPLAHTV